LVDLDQQQSFDGLLYTCDTPLGQDGTGRYGKDNSGLEEEEEQEEECRAIQVYL
jgi:hypothetical protein